MMLALDVAGLDDRPVVELPITHFLRVVVKTGELVTNEIRSTLADDKSRSRNSRRIWPYCYGALFDADLRSQ